ncbi:MAG: hypothetical protein LBH58_04400 [Tannerellaceae bacterium]|jgi:hypothetical protein|nr:hypothetical protein [Tannerellaceae bacterium]
MNRNGNELDQLTRTLFKSATLEPSLDLSRKIMDRITKEQPVKADNQMIIHVRSWRFSPWLIVGGIVYLCVAFFFLFYTFSGQSKDFLPILIKLKEVLPYLLTVIVILGSFPFFDVIDKALS